MKKSISKRAWSAVLALAIVFTALFSNVVTAKAATTDKVELFTEGGTAISGTETEKYSFTLDTEVDVDFGMLVPDMVGVTFNIYKEGSLYKTYSIAANDSQWYYFADIAAYDNGVMYTLSAGDYAVSYTFDTTTQYVAYADAYYAKAAMNQDKATITVGYTKKLSVSNGTVKKWTTKDKKIATVDSKGKVTAKKAGKTTIVATLEDGSQLTCKVTVKANKYTETKYTTNDISYDKWGIQVYDASFNSKGDLVLKVNIVNNTYHKVVELRNVKITVKDQNGKVVGTYKTSKKSITVPAYSTKTTSFTIKKSALNKKSADLRLGKATVSDSTSAWYYGY